MGALYLDQSVVVRGNRCQSCALKTERECCIISQYLFNVYTDSVIRKAEIEELGIKTDEKLVSNLRYAVVTIGV